MLFSPLPMTRLSVLVLSRDERRVVTRLGSDAALHLVHAETLPEAPPSPDLSSHRQMLRCEELLGRLETLCHALDIEEAQLPLAVPDMTVTEAEARLQRLETELQNLMAAASSFSHQSESLRYLQRALEFYQRLGVQPEEIADSEFLHFAIGVMPVRHLDHLAHEAGPDTLILAADEKGDKVPVAVISRRDQQKVIEKQLTHAEFEKTDLTPKQLPPTPAVPAPVTLDEVDEQLSRLKESMLTLKKTAVTDIASIRSALLLESSLLGATRHFSYTEHTVLLSAFAASCDAPRIEQLIAEATGGRYVMQQQDAATLPEHEIPTLVRPAPWLRPFHHLVAAFGLPKYREIVPTLFFALSYLVMFGMMFGDVGHGLVLVLGGLTASRLGKSPLLRDSGVLLLYAGISSTLFGVIYGSYLGLHDFKKYALWQDPLEGDPTRLMIAALVFGIFLISLGMVLNIVNRLARGDVKGALFARFGVNGFIFYWSALFIVVRRDAVQPGPLLLMALALVVWLLYEPLLLILARLRGHTAHGQHIFAALGEAVLETFEALLAYLANTISFVRIAAYSMSHAAMIMAIIMLSAQLQSLLPRAFGLGVLVFILGNLLIVLLEGLIATIQVLRLEYYEFFSKFFSADGRPFTPFVLFEKRR
jgi:V/A-type H+-transporting ATPase subunit I